ncbi:MAG: hypothetical protein JWL71_1029 [Acidobacteria bacterium]|nr:hypothetical protein [Acidobacteriota bacterium]
MSTLHITNGDDAGDKLRRFVDGPVALARDVLHEGPCPPVDGGAWHEVRARFLAGYGGATADEVKASLAADDRTIAGACRRGDAIVLWFEHDLFDQLAIIRTLDLLVRRKPDTTDTHPDAAAGPDGSSFSRTHPPVSLICIDRFPGVDRFVGLGQLTVEQLATLNGAGTSVTRGHYQLAVDAWRAFRSPDPRDLLQVAYQLGAAQLPVSEGGPALPFLGDALLRFLAEYPSVEIGLSRTEQLTLTSLLDGPTDAAALFGATQSREARPFMGDSTFFDLVARLASGRVPLVTVDRGPDASNRHAQRIAVTDAGREVLAGRADHIRLNGIDVWRGGVHLTGSDRSPWRWDARHETLVS